MKVILIITDGIGYKEETQYNAFYNAKKPHYDYLLEHVPHSLLHTYGKSVGLPDNQMGNSEVGHMCIGSGRVLYQDLVKINNAIESNTLRTNPVLTALLDSIKVLHLAILASNGGVHSHINHLKEIALIAKEKGKKVWLHLISDGRDVAPQSFLEQYKAIESIIDTTPHHIESKGGSIRVATLSGRFYAMDRDNRWERVQAAYGAIANGENLQECSIAEYVQSRYEQGEYDEFITPASFNDYQGIPKIDSNDPIESKENFINAHNRNFYTQGFMFLNYRSDRAREIVAALGLSNFNNFPRIQPNIQLVCMCEYDEKFPFPVLFAKDKVQNTLSEIISRNGLSQAHIAETEKYAHVTFFFNGGKEEKLSGEERLLVPSPKVKTYDLKPEMSAPEVADGVCDFINKGVDFIVVNFANGDMVGHTGNYEAAIKAVEAVDKELGKIWNLAKEKGYSIVLTSDHGNCEAMKDSNLKPLTNHTTGDVYCFIDAPGVTSVSSGSLANIAPTILKLMHLPIPDEMQKPLI